jgi:hypothetical protein
LKSASAEFLTALLLLLLLLELTLALLRVSLGK